MLMKIILLMIFCHIIDNFVLINKLEVMKQKLWWEDTCAKDGLNIEKYKDDYKMALLLHSVEWSIIILIPIFMFLNPPGWLLLLTVVCNATIRYIVDNASVNQFRLNLMQCQIIYFIQIIITCVILT